MKEIDSHVRLFEDDIDACVAVCTANHPKDLLLHEIDQHRDFLTKKPYAPAPYYVIEVAGKVVACGGVAIEGDAAHLCWGLVHPDWHGRGLGTKLVEHRLDWARSQPALKVVELYTSQKRVGFYERFGFKTIEVTKDGFGPAFDRHYMERSL